MVERTESPQGGAGQPAAKPSDSEGTRGHKPTMQPGRTPAPPPPPPPARGQGGS
jgi:hypothetical protein